MRKSILGVFARLSCARAIATTTEFAMRESASATVSSPADSVIKLLARKIAIIEGSVRKTGLVSACPAGKQIYVPRGIYSTVLYKYKYVYLIFNI